MYLGTTLEFCLQQSGIVEELVCTVLTCLGLSCGSGCRQMSAVCSHLKVSLGWITRMTYSTWRHCCWLSSRRCNGSTWVLKLESQTPPDMATGFFWIKYSDKQGWSSMIPSNMDLGIFFCVIFLILYWLCWFQIYPDLGVGIFNLQACFKITIGH